MQKAWALFLVAFLLYAVHGFATTDAKHRRVIVGLERTAAGMIVHANDGIRYIIDFDRRPYNRRNVQLLYEGKTVWIVWNNPIWKAKSEGCWEITPLEQQRPPRLTEAEYGRLVADGFTDESIAHSFLLPSQPANPNGEPFTYGTLSSYGAPAVCATKIEQ